MSSALHNLHEVGGELYGPYCKCLQYPCQFFPFWGTAVCIYVISNLSIPMIYFDPPKNPYDILFSGLKFLLLLGVSVILFLKIK